MGEEQESAKLYIEMVREETVKAFKDLELFKETAKKSFNSLQAKVDMMDKKLDLIIELLKQKTRETAPENQVFSEEQCPICLEFYSSKQKFCIHCFRECCEKVL